MVELVIKISEHYYENNIKNDLPMYLPEDNIIAILPKGHGRLIDADNMKRIDTIQRGDFNSIESIRAWIDIMPTVIKPDKEANND